ncbi:MAG: hypothetical protein ACYSTT_02400 [Planctomycetota bacterium]|jgi:prepilin-type processing-associated H-X9-DG protein
MEAKTNIAKKDLLVILCCFCLLLMNIGAIGSSGRRRAKERVCLSNLSQWGNMFEMFTNDNDGYFNRGWDIGVAELWMNALRPYYKDNWAMLLCPTATRIMAHDQDFGTFKAAYRDIPLPGGGSYVYNFSYGINSWTNNMTKDRGYRLEEWFWKNVQGVNNKSKIPVFADSTWHDCWPQHTDMPAPHPDSYWVGDVGATWEMNHFCIDRHNGAINMLFMDFSARKVGLKELWTLKWHRNYDTEGPWTRAGGVTMWDWPEWMRNFKEY